MSKEESKKVNSHGRGSKRTVEGLINNMDKKPIAREKGLSALDPTSRITSGQEGTGRRTFARG